MQKLPLRARFFILLLCTLAVLMLWYLFLQISFQDRKGIVFFLGLGLLAALQPIGLPRGGAVMTVSFALDYACILLYGPPIAVLIELVCDLVKNIFVRRVPFYKVAFNAAQYTLTVGLAGLVYKFSGGIIGSPNYLDRILPLVLCALTYLIINTSSISLIISLVEDISPVRVWLVNYKWMIINYLALSPLGILTAIIYQTVGLWSVLLLFLPLVIAHISFKSYMDVRNAHLNTLKALASTIDARDPYTHDHSNRVAHYSVEIARRLKLPEETIESIHDAALLHDIGKMGAKPGAVDIDLEPRALTELEYRIIKDHPTIGERIVKQLQNEELACWIRHHHERYDGSGYPDGLGGKKIPLGAHIIHVADAYDAMTTHRPYRPAKNEAQAIEELERCKGTDFDPKVADAFIAVLQKRNQEKVVEQIWGEKIKGKERITPQQTVFWQVLQNRNFSALWLGQIVSQLGDKLTIVALGILVFRLTGSALQVGLMLIATTLPHVLFGLIAGVLVDHWDKKGTLIVTDLIRAGLIMLIPWLAQLHIYWIYVISFLVSCATVFFDPAKLAFIPEIVKREELLLANSLSQATKTISDLIGYPIAGLVVGFLGTTVAFNMDSLSFLVSALVISAINIKKVQLEMFKLDLRGIFKDMARGMSFVRNHSSLFPLMMLFVVIVMAGDVMNTLSVPLALKVLAVGPLGYGFMQSSLGLGASMGGLLLGIIGGRFAKGKGKMIILGFISMGVFIVFLGISRNFYITLFIYCLIGIANMIFFIPTLTFVQEVTPGSLRGRVFSIRSTINRIAMLISMGLAGFFGDLVGVSKTLIMAGSLMSLFAVGSLFIKSIREI